jgi:hypothetical protein
MVLFKEPDSDAAVIVNVQILKRIVDDTAAFYRTVRDFTEGMRAEDRETFLSWIVNWRGPEIAVQIGLQVKRLDGEFAL